MGVIPEDVHDECRAKLAAAEEVTKQREQEIDALAQDLKSVREIAKAAEARAAENENSLKCQLVDLDARCQQAESALAEARERLGVQVQERVSERNELKRQVGALRTDNSVLREERAALTAERDEALREKYAVLWRALRDAGITRADGCPDAILAEEIERGRQAEAQRERLEAALREIASQELGDESWDALLAVADGAIECARAALAHPKGESR